jgi:hypothetical protein
MVKQHARHLIFSSTVSPLPSPPGSGCSPGGGCRGCRGLPRCFCHFLKLVVKPALGHRGACQVVMRAGLPAASRDCARRWEASSHLQGRVGGGMVEQMDEGSSIDRTRSAKDVCNTPGVSRCCRTADDCKAKAMCDTHNYLHHPTALPSTSQPVSSKASPAYCMGQRTPCVPHPCPCLEPRPVLPSTHTPHAHLLSSSLSMTMRVAPDAATRSATTSQAGPDLTTRSLPAARSSARSRTSPASRAVCVGKRGSQQPEVSAALCY